jgi:cytochrome c-type biogenesis protein CcmH/NrfG
MERVTRENPTHRNAWLNLGVVSADLGDRATAIRAWEQYLKLEPNGPHSASLRAQIEDMKRGS